MSANSKIEWCDDSINPWWGCTKVSPACKHCYAESRANYGSKAAFGERVFWGDQHPRHYRVERARKEAISLQKLAKENDTTRLVFLESMGDFFEGRPEQEPILRQWWKVIEETPNLRWLILTKRPQNILRLTPWRAGYWPNNIWVGCTIENQACADERLPHLLKVPSAVRFVSAEPLLGPLDLSSVLGDGLGKINWLITGGESGTGARGCQNMLGWFRSLRDQSVAAEVPFLFKQWGMFAQGSGEDSEILFKIGPKKNPDNRLDGAKWLQFPGQRSDPIVDYSPPPPYTRYDRIINLNII